MPRHPIPSGSLSSDPLSSDPMPNDPMTGYSISSDSLPSGPIPGDPMANQPAPSHPVAPGSVTPESFTSESVMSASLPSESIPDPATSANNEFTEKIAAADEFIAPSGSPTPADNPVYTDNLATAESSASEDISHPADSIVPAESSTSADSPGPGNIPDPADSLVAEIGPIAVANDEPALYANESASPEVGPVSEEIAIPIAPLPENQDPAPVQAIDLRQIADQPPSTLAPDLPALAEPSPPLQRQIPIATAAPLVAPAEPKATKPESATTAGSNSATALPLQLINQLLRKIGATPLVSLADMLPLLRILILAVLAGIALRLANATLGAIDDLPLVGGLLELVGLVTLLNFLARNAFKQKKRAELLARIQKLRTDLLG